MTTNDLFDDDLIQTDEAEEKPFRALGDLIVRASGRGREAFRIGAPESGPDPCGVEVINQIIDFLTQSLKHENPLNMVKDWVSAERTFETLIYEIGYPHGPMLRLVSSTLDEIGRLCRAECIKRLLIGPDDEVAKQALIELSGQIERGVWKNWPAEWQEVEDRVCADISNGHLKIE
jgi:hypothetical protein